MELPFKKARNRIACHARLPPLRHTADALVRVYPSVKLKEPAAN